MPIKIVILKKDRIVFHILCLQRSKNRWHYSKFKKKLFVLSLFSVPHDLFWPDLPQIPGQNKSEAREPEGLVKITYGIVASSIFKRAGNSNYEKFLNCEL